MSDWRCKGAQLCGEIPHMLRRNDEEEQDEERKNGGHPSVGCRPESSGRLCMVTLCENSVLSALATQLLPIFIYHTHTHSFMVAINRIKYIKAIDFMLLLPLPGSSPYSTSHFYFFRPNDTLTTTSATTATTLISSSFSPFSFCALCRGVLKNCRKT